jgi:hypothetical protein
MAGGTFDLQTMERGLVVGMRPYGEKPTRPFVREAGGSRQKPQPCILELLRAVESVHAVLIWCVYGSQRNPKISLFLERQAPLFEKEAFSLDLRIPLILMVGATGLEPVTTSSSILLIAQVLPDTSST